MNTQEQTAFDKGKKAYWNDQPESSNPYHKDENLQTWWYVGYQYAVELDEPEYYQY